MQDENLTDGQKDLQVVKEKVSNETLSALDVFQLFLERISVYKIFVTVLPNRHIFAFASGISSEYFGRVMVRILVKRNQAEVTMTTPNEPDMPSKCFKYFYVPVRVF